MTLRRISPLGDALSGLPPAIMPHEMDDEHGCPLDAVRIKLGYIAAATSMAWLSLVILEHPFWEASR